MYNRVGQVRVESVPYYKPDFANALTMPDAAYSSGYGNPEV